MTDHVYKSIKVTGSSSTSIDDAVKKSIAKAAKSLKGLRWFEVIGIRGSIDDDHNATWQVTVEIGFTLED